MTREQAIEMARAELHEDDVSVGYFDDGAEGAGWYAWITELPEEGSTLLVTSTGDAGERAAGWVATALVAAEAKGRAEGAQSMRERAAAAAERAHDADDGDSACRAGRAIARLVRALPLEPVKP